MTTDPRSASGPGGRRHARHLLSGGRAAAALLVLCAGGTAALAAGTAALASSLRHGPPAAQAPRLAAVQRPPAPPPAGSPAPPAPAGTGQLPQVFAGLVPPQRTLTRTLPSGLQRCITIVAAGATVRCASFDSATFSAPLRLPLQRPLAPLDPSMVVDSAGRIYVAQTGMPVQTAVPTGISSPLPSAVVFLSADGGRSFTETAAPADLGSTDSGRGGTTGIAIGDHDMVVVDKTWGTNAAMGYSTDRGQTWTGLPWSHAVPDGSGARAWLASDLTSGDVYMVWLANTGIHVGRALTHAALHGTAYDAPAALVMTQDRLVVPATASPAMYPGSITVDPLGRVWFAYAQQAGGGAGGIGIAESTDGGLTWTLTTVPGSGASGIAGLEFSGYPVIRGDTAGNVYVAWTEAADPQALDPRAYYSYMPSGAAGWHLPILASTTAVALSATLDVVAPGVVDVAYYGTNTGTRYQMSAGCSAPPCGPVFTGAWSLYVGQSTDALGAGHVVTDTAARNAWFGGLCVAILEACADGTQAGQPALRVDSAGRAQVVAPFVDLGNLVCPSSGSGRCTGGALALAFLQQRRPIGGDAGTTSGASNVLPSGGFSAGSLGAPVRYSGPFTLSTPPPAAAATAAGRGTPPVAAPATFPRLSDALPPSGEARRAAWQLALLAAALATAALGVLALLWRTALHR